MLTYIHLKHQSGLTDSFINDVEGAGVEVGGYIEGTSFAVDQDGDYDSINNIQYLLPLTVTAETNYISGIAGIQPSPDWYSSFYFMDSVDEYTRMFLDHFWIRTYPWDAGTDDGLGYTDPDRDRDPRGDITRITVENTPNTPFLNSAGTDVLPVAEWECVLHTCPIEDDTTDDCNKPDWPPANGCDIL
jgi:hypothetical protein